jgi:hypothetical protein
MKNIELHFFELTCIIKITDMPKKNTDGIPVKNIIKKGNISLKTSFFLKA